MSQRASSFMLTINNPTSADEEQIQYARSKGWKIEGQLEVGESGTPHYQLLVSKGQQRISAVKQLFPRAHIEITRNVVASQQYVNKAEGRLAPLIAPSDKYPSLAKFWELIYEELPQPEYRHNFIIMDFDTIRWRSDIDDKEKLTYFDSLACAIIEKGYYVESIASSNLNRTAWVRMGHSIMTRIYRESLRTKDRQTDALELEDSITVPTINGEGSIEERSVVSSEEDESSTNDEEDYDEDDSVSSQSDCESDDGQED